MTLQTTFIAGAIGIAATLAVGGMWGLERMKSADLGRKLATAESNLTTCRTNTASLSASLDTQSAAVGALAASGAAASAAATQAARTASVAVASAERTAGAIMARQAGGDVCESALALMREP